jgi:hypothetical protein
VVLIVGIVPQRADDKQRDEDARSCAAGLCG